MKDHPQPKTPRVRRRDFIKTTAAAGAALGAGALGRAAWADPPRARPNIVLILCDDMGYADIGCQGAEIDTPNLNALAQGGLQLTQFYNCARCCPTRASLLTGLYPHQAGMGWMTTTTSRDPAYQGYLNRECATIAEALKPAGYHALMTGKWHVGENRGTWPVDRGFDQYFGIIGGGCNYFRPGAGAKLARNDELVQPGPDFYTTDAFTDHAIDFIETCRRQDEGPYFLYLAFNAPHSPLHAKPEDIEKYLDRYHDGWDVLRRQRYERQLELGLIDPAWPLSPRDRATPPWKTLPKAQKNKMALKQAIFAAMIDRVDQNLGRLFAAIDRAGGRDNTLIMFLSDNGSSFEWTAWGLETVSDPVANAAFLTPLGGPDSLATLGRGWSNVGNAPFRLHKHWTHEGGISTPFIAHWPAVIKQPGAKTNQTGHLIDLMATCLDVAGASYPEERDGHPLIPLEGKSLLPIFQGQTREGHEAIYWEHEGNRAVRMGNWKLVSDHPGPWHLYDMEADRVERANLIAQNPSVARSMAGAYRAWAKRCGVLPWP